MKTPRFARIGAVLATLLFLLGCLAVREQQGTRSTASQTNTPQSTEPSTLASTRTPFQTQLPTVTWPPIPTLNPKERSSFFEKMLATNGGCELPCWWGITPGETTWEELLTFFNTQGVGILEESVGEVRYIVLNLDYSGWGYGGVEFLGWSGLVQSIHIQDRDMREYDPVQESYYFLNEFWDQLTLPNALLRFGVPTQVYVGGSGTSSHSDYYGFYNLWVEYNELGILIGYSGTTIEDGTGYLVCPLSAGVEVIELRLQTPGSTLLDGQVLERTTGGTRLVRLDEYVDLAELGEMTPQKFYETFSRPDTPGCIRVTTTNYDVLLTPDFTPVYREEDAILLDLLTTNGDCELPCWWGITPGVTSLQDAQQVFLSYGKGIGIQEQPSEQTSYTVGLFGRHDPYPFDYIIRHRVYAQDGTVSYIRVTGEALGWLPPRHFTQDWHRYSLDQILTRFGPPSQVMLHYYQGEDALYEIGVIYDDLGILIEYSGIVSHSPVVICPRANEVFRINICLVATDGRVSLADEFQSGCWFYRDSSPSLEEATELTAAEFYQTYLDPDTHKCFEANEDLAARYP